MSYQAFGQDDEEVPPTGGLEPYAQPTYIPPTGGLYDYGTPTQPDSTSAWAIIGVSMLPLLFL